MFCTIVVSDAVQYTGNQLGIITGHGKFQHPAFFTAFANGKGFLQRVNHLPVRYVGSGTNCVPGLALISRDSQRNAIFFQTLADHTIDGELFTFQRIVAVFPTVSVSC